MLLVSEPEAAAIYTARHLTEERGASFLRVSAHKTKSDAIYYSHQHRKANALCYVMQAEELL